MILIVAEEIINVLNMREFGIRVVELTCEISCWDGDNVCLTMNCCFSVCWLNVGAEGKTTKCVGDDVGFAGVVLRSEGIRLESDDPADHTVRGSSREFEISRRDQLNRRFIVTEESKVMVTQIGTKLFNRPYNSEKFFFPHGVMALSIYKHLRDECYRAITMFMRLGKNCTKCVVAGVCCEKCFALRIEDSKALGISDSVFECVYCFSVFISPYELSVLTGE